MTTKLTTEDFIHRAVLVHGSQKYSYHESVYENNHKKIKIWCNTCSEFFYQSAYSHWAGKGCKQCGVNKRTTDRTHNLSLFIEKMKEFGRPVYDYSKAVYKTTHTKMSIGCLRHGFFEVTPNKLLQNRGCPVCANETRASRTSLGLDRFIEKSNEIHGIGTYDYSMCSYVNNHTPVCIICPTCGPFSQLPQAHLQKSGCPTCADTGFNPGKPAKLYIHNIVNCQHSFTGFGITRNLKSRTRSHTKNLNREGYLIVKSFVSDELDGKFIQQLENILKETFPVDTATSHLDGFKRESTTAPYHEVVAFVQQYIEQNKEPHGDT